MFAIPALIVLAIVLWQARDGLDILAARLLLVPAASFMLVVVSVLLGGWRLVSMGAVLFDPVAGPLRSSIRSTERALRSASSRPTSWSQLPRRTAVTFAVLAALVVGMHGVVAWTGLAFFQGFSNVYVAQEPQSTPAPGATPGDSGLTPRARPTPKPNGRINVLLIGADSGLGYDHSLTDTIILVSVDPTAKTVDMISMPRDIAKFQLFSGGTFNGKINSLATYAASHPDQFPDGGLGTLTREVEYLIGAPIHYYAYVNLAGFESVINAVGGVDIVNPKQISDARFQFPDLTRGFFLTAGPHHLDSRLALAYVRSRYGPGDNDFTRARRQQGLLIALKSSLLKPGNLGNLPTILDALGKTVQTDFPADGLPDLLVLAKQIPSTSVTSYVLGPPYAKSPVPPTSTYQLIIDESRFAALSIRLFGAESRYASPSPSPSGGASP